MAFSSKPFSLMTPEDYANIGLKCGLEIHQQLLTERKLFCRCRAGCYSNHYDAEILRHMRPTLSELGEYDGTALMEKKTRKNIYYRLHRDSVCTYEMDDTPPFFMDGQALDIAVEIALLLRLSMIGELHIARKQYLDGSIPTGFQRTTILGVNGWVPYRDRRIGIRQLGLEEDACREVSDVGHDRVYLTDRLGMPLVETVTEPDMRTPQEAAEVAQILRLLCRSTGKVRTGYGAAREDVNVSVAGGTRVEIKGVPQISRIPILIHNEALRQCALLRIRGLLKERGVTPETFRFSVEDVTRTILKSEHELIRAALQRGHHVKCVCLRGFAGILNEPTQENTLFAKEFSDRIRVVACLTQLPNMVHSDTDSEAPSDRIWKDVHHKMRSGPQDVLVLVWGDQDDTTTACNEIVLRAREATEGVPNDTRQPLRDGTNGFERVLPGPNRMYPDTDLPPLIVSESKVRRIRARLPEYVWDRQARYRKMGLPEDVIVSLCTSPRADIFQRIVDELGIPPVFASVVLCHKMRGFRRRGLAPEGLTDGEIFAVFKLHAEGGLAREGVPRVLRRILESGDEPSENRARVEAAIETLNFRPLSAGEASACIDALVAQADSRRFRTVEKRFRSLMGMMMKELVGCADGGKVARELHEKLNVEVCGELPSTAGRPAPQTR